MLKKTMTVASVMQISRLRAETTRLFNKELKTAGRDVIVRAAFYGQLKHDPYTMFTGGLSGLNGKIMRREGAYDV